MTAADRLQRRRKREQQDVQRLMEEGKEKEDRVFLESCWFRKWCQFVEGGEIPGVVCFDGLLDAYGEIRDDLEPDTDYISVPRGVWEYFQTIYLSEQPVEGLTISSATRWSDASFEALKTPPETEFPGLKLLKQNIRNSLDAESGSSDATTSNLFARNKKVEITLTKGLVGIANPGLYCYMNASLQMLMSIEPLRLFFFLKNYLTVENRSSKQYCEAFSEITCQHFSSSSGFSRPSRLWSLTSRKFNPHKMHDAQEFIHYFLDSIDCELALKRTRGQINSKWVKEWLVGALKSEVRCLKCRGVNCVSEEFLELALPMEKSVKKALRLFCTKETLEGSYDCEKCRKKTDMVKTLSIEKSPQNLILSLKRFKQFPSPQKSSAFVKFCKHLSLPQYILHSSNSAEEYKLTAVIEHRGRELSSGHYVAYCCRGHLWYLFDDKICTQVLLKDVLSAQAFVLLYRRV